MHKKFRIRLSNEAKAKIMEVYLSKKDCKTGREFVKIVINKTVGRKTIRLPEGAFSIVENALKATTIEPEWLDLLLVVTDEVSNALSQIQESSPKIKKE